MEIYHSRLSSIRDGDLLTLVGELEQVCPVSSALLLDLPLSTFLTQCVYPAGDGKRVPISTAASFGCSLLETRVGKLSDGSLLLDLCRELAENAGKGIEFFLGNKVYVFLNKTILRQEKPKKQSVEGQRWSDVVSLRRRNR